MELPAALRYTTRTCGMLPIHPSFVEDAEQIAKAGDVEEAIQRFQLALEIDSGLEIVPEKRAKHLAAQSFLDSGRQVAKNGQIKEATALLQRAQQLNPGLNLEPEQEARQLAAQALLERGQEVAWKGDIESATDLFTQARQYNPRLKLQPKAKAEWWAAQGLVDRAKDMIRLGVAAEALEAYSEAQSLSANLKPSADDWNYLCWVGSLSGQAGDVMPACEQAVALEPKNGEYRDSRGVAKALSGDSTGAIEDFLFFVEWAQGKIEPNLISQRQSWIQSLRTGQNPFDKTTLEEIYGQ